MQLPRYVQRFEGVKVPPYRRHHLEVALKREVEIESDLRLLHTQTSHVGGMIFFWKLQAPHYRTHQEIIYNICSTHLI